MTAFYRTDRFGNPLGRLGYVYSAQRDRTTNGTDVLDISCKTQCDKGDRIVFIDSAGNPREYIITDLEQTREDSLDFTYHCSNSITELALFFIEERRSRSENAQQMLTRVLEGTRWHVGSVTTGGANNLSFYHVSAYQAILDICELWGLEWETQLTISADGSHINGRSINLVPHVGSTSARRFDFGKNLVGLSRTVDSTNVITRLYPYGNSVQETDASGEATGGYSRKIDISSVNGGKTYIEDAAATLVWGVPDASGQVQPAMGMEEYDADDPATLLAMAQADLPNLTQPKVSYTATVATLGIEGVDRYGIGVGDDVYVNDTAYPTPIRLKGRVLEIVDDLVDPLSDDTQITLGNLVETYTADMDRVSGIVDMLTSNAGIWNDAANATPSYIDSVIAGLNQQLNQTGGYVYLEPNEGLIVYDRPKDENPTMAIQLGGGYFRIANSKNSDGSWNWRTIGTGAGLVADQFVGYVFTGAIYQSSTEENTGFKLRDAGLDMWDSEHNQTVHLDGNGGDNLLTGTFQTALSGRRVRISPDFSQYEVEDSGASIVGSGIQLFLDGTAASHPYIASESSVSDEGQVSGIVINGGRRDDDDPGAFLRVGERGASGDRHGIVRLSASQKYSDSSAPNSYMELYAPQSSGPTAIIRADNGARHAGYYANSDQAYSYMYAGDSNGTVGMQADIDTGYLYFGGYLGRLAGGRGTFQRTNWRMFQNATIGLQATLNQVTWTFGTPAKYGHYYGVVSSDVNWGSIFLHVCNTGSASTMQVMGFNAASTGSAYTGDIWADAFAWLTE